MTVKQYSNISTYLSENLDFLEKREAVNNLLIGIPISLKNEKVLNPFPVLLSVHAGNSIVFSAIQTPPKNLLVSGDALNHQSAAVPLIDFMIQNNIIVPGVIGPKKVSTFFAEKWCAKNNIQWQTKYEQLIYRLDEIKEIKYTNGFCRKAKMKDLDIVGNWFHAFAKEAMDEDDRQGAILTAENKITTGGLFIWENNGRAVSMAAASRPSRNGIAINYVYTPAEFRGHGYATAVVGKLTELMLKKYRFCSLFTDQANPTSNSIYSKIGYRPIEEFRMIEFI
ncbi:MAG: GNAT family N-acetyltransferase [Bacteroidota bacterium]